MKYESNEYLDKIDFEYIQNIVINNQNKKIFCFGSGSAAKILMHELGEEIQIDRFLDNNSLLHGKRINGIEIVNPQSLCTEERGKYIVLILSRHIYSISTQLDSYGLEAEQDYFNVYSKFLPYFMIRKHMSLAEEFMEFINRIPDEELNNRPILYNDKIGVVYVSEMYANYTSYCLAQVLLLRYYGYHVSLIIDTLPSFNSYCLFEGVEEIIRKQVDKIAYKIQSKCSDIEIMYIDQEGKSVLSTSDQLAVREGSKATLIWYDSQREYPFLPEREQRETTAENIISNALMYIKSFFSVHKYKSINVLAGIGNHRGMYLYYGKKIGMRVSTYDNFLPGKMTYSIDGAAAHVEDVTKLVKGEYFKSEEKGELIQYAKENFRKRKNSTVKNEGYNYQVIEYKRNKIIPYDVVIPLNIIWDASALQRDRIFSDVIDWLNQTLEFIMKKTDATVLVREHPAQNLEPQFIYESLREKLSIILKHNERIFWVAATDDINTYQYIEQCKLVLPYTSTVGIEAVIMGKNVITHTNVYYNDIDVVIKAQDKKEYFDNILYYIRNTDLSNNININNAYLAYFFLMNISFECEYYMYNTSWMKMSLKKLSEVSGADWIVAAVGKGVPITYSKIKNNILSVNRKTEE